MTMTYLPVTGAWAIIHMLQDTIFPHAWVAGSYARMLMLEGSPQASDLDIVAYTTYHQKRVKERLEYLGFSVALETDNAYNFSHPTERTEVDLLKKRVGHPNDLLPKFPLYNQAFALLSPYGGIALDSAISNEAEKIVSIQNWFDPDEHNFISHKVPLKYLARPNASGQRYNMKPSELSVLTSHYPIEVEEYLVDNTPYLGRTSDYLIP